MCVLRVIITSAWRENTCRASSLPSSHFWVRHGPTAVDIINPNPRCNAISAHCARATSGYETQFSLFTPFPMRTPFSPYPVSFILRGKKRGGGGGGYDGTSSRMFLGGVACFWPRRFSLSPPRSLFLRDLGQREVYRRRNIPGTNIPDEGRRRGGRKGYECHPQALIDAIQRPLDATMDGGCTPMSFPVAIVEGAQLEET